MNIQKLTDYFAQQGATAFLAHEQARAVVRAVNERTNMAVDNAAALLRVALVVATVSCVVLLGAGVFYLGGYWPLAYLVLVLGVALGVSYYRYRRAVLARQLLLVEQRLDA